jgi:hypothetical protein
MVEDSKHWWLRWSLLLPALALATAVCLQCLNLGRAPMGLRSPGLVQSIPAHLPGWTSRDVPLGSTEFLSNEAEKVLNFDEMVNREFSRGAESFGLYVVYWGAGKMPTRLVASHTPDRCWTENGWKCLDMKFKQPEVIAGVPLQPAEWRVFEPPGFGPPIHVIFWHLVDGRTYDYGERFNSVPDPLRWWKDVIQQAVRGNREQYFIRLTSSQPLENLWNDPGFATIVRSLGSLGLTLKDRPSL